MLILQTSTDFDIAHGGVWYKEIKASIGTAFQ